MGGAYMPEVGSTPVENSWIKLFSDYKAFWDNRGNKQAGVGNPKRPDFSIKNKEQEGEFPALWIVGKNTPSWVHDKLNELPPPPPPRTPN